MIIRGKWLILVVMALFLAVMYSYCGAAVYELGAIDRGTNSDLSLEQLVMAPYKITVYGRQGPKYEIGLVNPIGLEKPHIYASMVQEAAGIMLKPFLKELGKWILIPYSNIRYIKAS